MGMVSLSFFLEFLLFNEFANVYLSNLRTGGLVLKVPTIHVNTEPEASLIYVEDSISMLPLEGNREDTLQLSVKVYLTLIFFLDLGFGNH